MVEDPVEGRRREHGIDRRVEVEVQQVDVTKLDPVPEGTGQRPPRRIEHADVGVDPDDPAAGQAFQQGRRHPSRAAAGIEHRLVPRRVNRSRTRRPIASMGPETRW